MTIDNSIELSQPAECTPQESPAIFSNKTEPKTDDAPSTEQELHEPIIQLSIAHKQDAVPANEAVPVNVAFDLWCDD